MTPFQEWQIAFIYAFSFTFHTLDIPLFHHLPLFTPYELTREIELEESELVHQIICTSLSNCLNPFQQLVQQKMKSLDITHNPLTKQPFKSLPVDTKLDLLQCLIEWQLQDNQALKQNIQGTSHTTSPIGIDSKKRIYWQFGDSCWVWREKPNKHQLDEWETVCKDREGLESLVHSLSAKHKTEGPLREQIIQLYPLADQEQENERKRQQKAARKAIVPVLIEPPQLRTRRQPVHYNHYFLDSEVPETAPTRISHRLQRKQG
ncbi:hypothetical protein BD560DRAFT_436014 [Blakeslea trispora]|nr:hypothetical protein BD560DRAFT_436014 [Blakeslea trispora]